MSKKKPKERKKKESKVPLFLTAAGLSVIFAAIIFFASNTPSPVEFTPIPTSVVNQVSLTPLFTGQVGKCRINGLLPDKNCTPGAIDPRVTQENIQQTICVSGYSGKVRPPVSYTNKLKIQQIKEYGYTDTTLANYEEDHLISLQLGGNPTDPKNLWPEPGRAPNPKDKIENLCHRKVCKGEIPLASAQAQIATNWPTACQ